MARNLGFILLLICGLQSLKAQDQQYIVKINGDTIYGRLMINPVRDNSREMFFKSEDGTKEKIRPLRTTYVYFNPKYQFRSVIFRNQRLFMHVVFEDKKLSLYNYTNDRDNSLVTSRVAVKSTGEALELSVLNFRNQVKDFLADCPELAAKVDAKEYKYKSHQALFAAYNQCDVVLYTTGRQPETQAQTQPQAQTPEPTQVQAKDQVQTKAVKSTTTPAVTSSGNAAATEVATTAVVGTATTSAVNSGQSDIQKLRLQKLEEFKTYVKDQPNFQFSKDVLDLVVDLENRVNQNSEIPGYLWTTLDAMVQDHQEMREKARQLKLDIR